MSAVANELWPYIITVLISVFGTYFTLIHKLKDEVFNAEKRIAVLEVQAESLKNRVDSHSGKIDEILEGINEIKVNVAKINTTLSIIDKG
jgi:peptidoglycan hydrolase CwlO-like protein